MPLPLRVAFTSLSNSIMGMHGVTFVNLIFKDIHLCLAYNMTYELGKTCLDLCFICSVNSFTTLKLIKESKTLGMM